MNKKLVIIGAGGHGKVCSEIARLNGFEDIVFLDDDADKQDVAAGTIADFPRFLQDHLFFVAIGNNALRQKITHMISAQNGRFAALVHPAAAVSPDAVISAGAVVMAGAVINPCAVVGEGAVVNTSGSLDHDNRIGDFAMIGVGAHLAGTVTVGERTFIGAGATVINNITICDDCLIGAGAVVVCDINEAGTYVGVPAKRIK